MSCRACVVLLALLPLACGGASPADERFPLARPQDVDPARLVAAHSRLSRLPASRSILVERHGVVVMEEYLNGANADEAFDVRSVTKSVISLLVGIAIAEGNLTSLDEPIGPRVLPLLPDLPPDRQAITLRHLLTMTSGLPWNELRTAAQDYPAFASAADPLRWILERPLEHAPGTHWHYNTGSSHILGVVLAEAVGMPLREYAQRRLLGPLDSEVRGWESDPKGRDHGGYGIQLSAPTLVKLGRLVLGRGRHLGREIVPDGWIRESTAPLNPTDEALPWGTHYGFLWWSGRDEESALALTFATGYGGQFLLMVPERDAVVVATTEWNGVPDAANNWLFVLRTIGEEILPALA